MRTVVLSSVWDHILDFFAEITDFTHFLNTAWENIKSIFILFTDFVMGGVNAVTEFFDNIQRFGTMLAELNLLPDFAVPYLGIFLVSCLVGVALSAILELL